MIGAEIDVLRQMGVAFQTGTEVGKDVTIQQLRDQGYAAFYVAIGAQKGARLNVEGEDAADVISGDAINLGQDLALSGGVNLKMRREREYHYLDREHLAAESFDRMPRQKTAAEDHHKTSRSFQDQRTDFTEEQLRREASRCLGCGRTYVDEYMCLGCGVCASKCGFDAISLKKKYNVEPAEPMQLVQEVGASIVARANLLAEKKARAAQ